MADSYHSGTDLGLARHETTKEKVSMARGIATMEDGRYLDASIDRAQDLLEQARTLVNGHMADVTVRSISLHTGGERSMPRVTVACMTHQGQRFTVTLQ